MAHLAEGVWRDVLDEIQRDIGEHQFYSWFKNLGLRDYDRDSATLTVPNLFTRDWVSGKYSPLIQSAFERVTGQAPRILFEVDPASAVPLVPSLPAEKGPARPSSFISEVQLNSNYSFSQFVVGPSNRLPHAASVAVAENPANAYNPLFLHGAVGLGKTHLLQAICHELLARRPDMRILYLSCESFVNQFIAAIQRGELVTFRYRYRHIDALVIDDIHFLANK
ncbi:MAG: ATP-binding protein [Planctomycetes bacterium]|nr:ATP-binding protein [Planctomycetota bacterium]